MNKIHSFILKYLVLSFPAVVILLVWGFIQGQQDVLNMNNIAIYVIREILSWHLMAWFVILICTLGTLLLSSKFRDAVFAKLARIRDRDERESHIIGRAGRFSFFSTLALLVFLLFFATLNISVSRIPPEKAVDGKRHSLSIGMSFNLWEQKQGGEESGDVIVSTGSRGLSKQIILLLLIGWHMGTFLYCSNKLRGQDIDN
jgi:hypothetical protein